MRGVNLGGWFSQIDAIEGNDPDPAFNRTTHIETFLGPSDFSQIKHWGFDHVRLPVDYFNLFDSESLIPEQYTMTLLERAVDDLGAAGLAVILDMHKCPGHDFHAGTTSAQSFFTDASIRNSAKRVWAQLSERFASRQHVLFELLNEPVAEDPHDWDRVKNELAAEIRAHAPKSTLVVGSNRWNNPTQFEFLTPLDDDQVVYSFHFYSPALFTHQLAPWLSDSIFSERRTYPGEYVVPKSHRSRLPLEIGYWDRARMEAELEQALLFRQRYQVRVACNEFGVYAGGADRASQLRWIDDLLAILGQHGIGFSYWNYKNLDFGIRSVREGRFAGYPQYENADRLDHELLELLRSR